MKIVINTTNSKVLHALCCLVGTIVAACSPLGLRWLWFAGNSRLPSGYETAWMVSCVVVGAATVVVLFCYLMMMIFGAEPVWAKKGKQ